MNIAVGMSGGVDSSVTALLLKEAGHEVVGIMMSIWSGKQTHNSSKHACYGSNEPEEIELAGRVCKSIGIPFYVFDCSKEYQQIVLYHFKTQYLKGITPNPCVICNQKLKFDILPDVARKSLSFEKFATGHYAKIGFDLESNRYFLRKAKDIKKDQTYFLYRLSQNQLMRSLFPLGDLVKKEVREYAKKKGLPSYEEKESQDFYDGDYQDLLDTPEKPGNIVDINGKILGTHQGFWNYTIGQRKGLGVSSKNPLYVTQINEKSNQVVVGTKEEGERNSFCISQIVWGSRNGISEEIEVQVKTRSTQSLRRCRISPSVDPYQVKVTLDISECGISPGQSAVLYEEDQVLGGGFIDGPTEPI